MTMFAFSKTIFQPTHLKEPEMTLFIIYAKCTQVILAAYWADSMDDAYDAAAADGFDPDVILPLQATPEQQAPYHGPDFAGRRLYKIDFVSERGEFADETVYVAADTIKDAAGFADEFTNGRNRFICLIPPGTELDFVEPGWDQ